MYINFTLMYIAIESDSFALTFLPRNQGSKNSTLYFTCFSGIC